MWAGESALGFEFVFSRASTILPVQCWALAAAAVAALKEEAAKTVWSARGVHVKVNPDVEEYNRTAERAWM